LNHRDYTLRARVERLLAAIVMLPGHPSGPQQNENIRFWLLLALLVVKRPPKIAPAASAVRGIATIRDA
jgi:hypothetical protein